MKGNHFERGGLNLESPERFRVGTHTLPSERRPEQNQDVILLDKENGIFAVFDGVGGHAAGETAAKNAREFIAGRLREIPEGASPQEIAEAVESALIEANKEIFKKAKTDPDQYRGMGTTASVVKVWESGNERKAIIGNVGDSRVYKLSVDGRLEQITIDDSFWRGEYKDKELREIQKKFSNLTDLSTLSKLEGIFWNYRNVVSQVLGSKEKVVPRINIIEISKGEGLLITTDGSHDNLVDERIEKILNQAGNPEEAARSLVSEARERSREDRKKNPRVKQDDMSAIVVEF